MRRSDRAAFIGGSFFAAISGEEQFGLEEIFIKKMIKQHLFQYHFTPEEPEAESIYRMLMDRVQQRRETDDSELYEMIEDEVYSFITNA
ncbi:hypothetical protein SD78_2280 [Bacillus badius]|nr:hypothetical protein SD78_2280 [Bacillus badius]